MQTVRSLRARPGRLFALTCRHLSGAGAGEDLGLLGGLSWDGLPDLLVWKSPGEAEDMHSWVRQLRLHAGGPVPRQTTWLGLVQPPLMVTGIRWGRGSVRGGARREGFIRPSGLTVAQGKAGSLGMGGPASPYSTGIRPH